jgi:hypothetical protein
MPRVKPSVLVFEPAEPASMGAIELAVGRNAIDHQVDKQCQPVRVCGIGQFAQRFFGIGLCRKSGMKPVVIGNEL